MKRLLLLLLMCSVGLFAQERQNEIIYRGDKTDLSFYYTDGDVTANRLRFVIKEDFKLSSPRLVQKGNAFAGGDSTQLEALYSNDTTFISVHLRPTDTDSLEPQKYRYDIVSIDTADTTNSVTIFAGVINLKSDVQTPYDGVPVGGDYTQWNSFAPGSILIVDTLGGEKFLSSAEPGSEKILGYKIYSAQIRQKNTDDPVAYIFANTLGDTLTWTRIGIGIYRGILLGAFPSDNTLIFVLLNEIKIYGTETFIYGSANDDYIELRLYDESFNPVDNVDRIFLRAEIYP